MEPCLLLPSVNAKRPPRRCEPGERSGSRLGNVVSLRAVRSADLREAHFWTTTPEFPLAYNHCSNFGASLAVECARSHIK